MHARHGITPVMAEEVLADSDRVVFDPDPHSLSGRSVHTIGYSATFDGLVTVITVVVAETRWGVNGWPSNSTDSRIYRERNL